jgi:hypothetical protein
MLPVMQVRAAEYKVLAGYLLNLQEEQGNELLWAACDACKRWRLVDRETHQKVARGSYFCHQDTRRPICGCNVWLLPHSGQVQDDEEIMKETSGLVCGSLPAV